MATTQEPVKKAARKAGASRAVSRPARAAGTEKGAGKVPRSRAAAASSDAGSTGAKKTAAPAKKAAATATKAVPAKKAATKTTKTTKTKKETVKSDVTPTQRAATDRKAAPRQAARRAVPHRNGDAEPAAGTPHRQATAAGPYAEDEKFLSEQRQLLVDERAVYEGQASDLKAEADSLAQEREPGDVQFDEESGEGGTVTVDRERDLALSAQALAAVEEIDAAVRRIDARTYGACERCQQAIPKPRLKALPYARLCVACKSGGLSRR